MKANVYVQLVVCLSVCAAVCLFVKSMFENMMFTFLITFVNYYSKPSVISTDDSSSPAWSSTCTGILLTSLTLYVHEPNDNTHLCSSKGKYFTSMLQELLNEAGGSHFTIPL